MQAPSVTNRFFTSWHWLWAFKTDVFGSRPMRAVPISWMVRPGGVSSTNGWMSTASAAPLKSVAAQEVRAQRLHVAEPGDVDAVGTVAVDGGVFHARDGAVRPAAHRVVHQVPAQLAARVGETGGEARPLGVEQDARRFECRGTQKHDARAELERLVGLPVDDAHARRPVTLLVVDDAVNDTVGPEREPPRGARHRQRHADAVEVGVGDAAALARAAVVTRRASPVRCREDRHPADGDDALGGEALRDPVPDDLLGAVERHRREEFPVGQLRQAERLAADPDELLDVIVPRRDVGIADRPIHPEAVARVGFEVEVAPAVHLSAPHDGLATHLAAADPVERLVGVEGVWVLAVVDEELAAVLVARVAGALDELVTLERLAVPEAPELHLPRGHVLDVIPRGVDRPTGLEHERLEPALAQLLRRPPARDAGADDDGVEARRRHQ